MNMAFNRFLSRQQVIDAYQIPKKMESELFAVLRPVFGPGEEARYLESHVDEALKQWSSEKGRPQDEGTEFSQEEEKNVIAINSENEPWTRIADSLEKILDLLCPSEKAPLKVEQGDRGYSTAEASKLLNRHPDVVRQYCRNRVLGTRDASGKWVILQSEIEKFRTGQVLVHGSGAR